MRQRRQNFFSQEERFLTEALALNLDSELHLHFLGAHIS